MHYLAAAFLHHACLLVLCHGAPSHRQLALVTDADGRDGDALLRAVATEADIQLSTVAALRDGAKIAMEAASEVEADSELDLGNMQGTLHGAGEGPATLEEYCGGMQTTQEKQSHLKEGSKVMANWEGYGDMYEGRIEDENVNGTVDIHYTDGFHEKNVAGSHVEPHPESQKSQSTKTSQKRDDAACEMKDFLKETKKDLKEVNGMIKDWMQSQRAKIAGDKAAPVPPPSLQHQPVAPPPAAPAAAPPASPAAAPPPSTGEEEELEKLKAELVDREKYIQELQARFDENNQELQRYVPAAPPAPAGLQTVDSLMQQYKARIADSDFKIAELEAAIADQEKELKKLSGKQMSLAEIDAAVTKLEAQGAIAEQKRDELEKAGTLDSELGAIIDSIVKALKKTRAKVDQLMALEAQAKARQQEVDAEALEAAEAARKRAKELGLDPDKAADEAIAEVKRKNEASLKTADLEVMSAAQEMGEELSQAEKGANRLDTGLHPHGSKWWRYRYEYSYIEAILMIFISFLMLIWSEIVYHFRVFLNKLAASSKERMVMQREDQEEQDAHNAAILSWLRMLTEQMCVCVFVFLTVWGIAKSPLLAYAPVIIRPSDDMRVPMEPDEYRRLALDICTIFFIAIVFYFGLMFSVARETRYTTQQYDELDDAYRSESLGVSRPIVPGTASEVTSSFGTRSSFGPINTTEEYRAQLKHFQDAMKTILDSSTDAEMLKLKSEIGSSLDRFPLSMYLTLCVRINVAKMFFFGWVMWLPTIALFLALGLLHRFAHMGYVRIMGMFGIVVLVILGYMAYLTSSIKSPKTSGKERIRTTSMEVVVLALLQFSLFFVCYGVARMMCQSWMWELHFWPVLALTVCACVSAFLFIWFIAPAIPIFCAAMAMPPYVDSGNVQCMINVMKDSGGPGGRSITSPI
jgi:hypothetical protein